MRFYYEANTNIARNNSNPNGKYKVKAVGYPNLAAPISSDLGTDSLRFTRDVGGTEDIQTIILEKGLYNTTELVVEINKKMVLMYQGVTDPLTIELVSENSVRWNNIDIVPWKVEYLNRFSEIIISGVDEETITVTNTSEVYVTNPTYGLKGLTLVVRNGPSITLPASGSYLDNGLFYLPVQDIISATNNFECHLEAEYMSERNTSILECPRKDGIVIILINYSCCS